MTRLVIWSWRMPWTWYVTVSVALLSTSLLNVWGAGSELVGKWFRKTQCSLSPDPGPCSGKFTRYFYNGKTDSCNEFTHGGCLGNMNSFGTADQCKQICGGAGLDTDLKEEIGQPGGAIPTTRTTITTTTTTTPTTTTVSTTTVPPIDDRCVTPWEQEKLEGSCPDRRWVYVYHKGLKRCVLRKFGTCLRFHFGSMKACEKACKKQKRASDEYYYDDEQMDEYGME